MPLLMTMQQIRKLKIEDALTSDARTCYTARYDLAIRLGRLQDSSMIATGLRQAYVSVRERRLYLERTRRATAFLEFASHKLLLLQ